VIRERLSGTKEKNRSGIMGYKRHSMLLVKSDDDQNIAILVTNHNTLGECMYYRFTDELQKNYLWRYGESDFIRP